MITKIRDSFFATIKNKTLLKFGFLEAGAILVFSILYYLLFLAILQIQLGVPTDVILNYFMNEALPQQANQILLIGTIVFSLLLMVLLSFFESGIFSLVSGKSFEKGIQSTGVFVVLAIFFEIADFVLLLIITGFGLLIAFLHQGTSQLIIFLLLLLAQLFFMAWRANARFTALKKGPVNSFREALFFIVQKPGLWARAILIFLLFAVLIVVLLFLLLFLALIVLPWALILLLPFVLAVLIITNLVFKVFVYEVRKSQTKVPKKRR